MQLISDNDACKNFDRLLESVCLFHEPVAITRRGVGTAILIEAGEYSSMEETLHLLSTPTNAERIQQGLADYATGRRQPGELRA